MPPRHSSGLAHALFKIGVVIKAIDGVFEVIGGVLLFFVTPRQTYRLIRILTENEIFGSRHGALAQHATHALQNMSDGTRIFASVYLLAHGIIKIGLVAGLLLRKKWAYPTAIAAFVFFLVYQMYRYTARHSVSLLLLSALDLFVIVMTVLEFRRLLAEHAFDGKHGSHHDC